MNMVMHTHMLTSIKADHEHGNAQTYVDIHQG